MRYAGLVTPTRAAEVRPPRRWRPALWVLLALVIAWWITRDAPRADEATPTAEEAEARSRPDAAALHRRAEPTARGVYLRTCPGEGAFSVLRRAPGSIDRTGDLKGYPIDCVPSAAPDGRTGDPYGVWCVSRDLVPGEYVLVQGARSQKLVVDRVDASWAALGCEDTCAQSVQVSALDSCAMAGELSLTNGLPSPWSAEIAAGTWSHGVPTVLHDIPCSRLSLRASGGTCAPVLRLVDAGDGTQLHAIELVPSRPLAVTVRDAATGAPVQGARVIAVGGETAFTDTRGRTRVVLGAYEFQAAIILANGYAGHDLLDQEIAWGRDGGGTVEVVLEPTRPLLARCAEGDRPCAEGTPLSTHGAGQRTRSCEWLEPGVWNCLAADGDVVTARNFARRAQVKVPTAATEVALALPPAEHAMCFELPPGEACMAVVSGMGVAARQRVRSGEPVDLGLSEDPLVGLACAAGSWQDVVTHEAENCLLPEFAPPGSLCVPDGRDCEVVAVEPAWDNIVRRPTPCVEDLPPGRYSVTCGDAGIDEISVESGKTANVADSAQ